MEPYIDIDKSLLLKMPINVLHCQNIHSFLYVNNKPPWNDFFFGSSFKPYHLSLWLLHVYNNIAQRWVFLIFTLACQYMGIKFVAFVNLKYKNVAVKNELREKRRIGMGWLVIYSNIILYIGLCLL